MQGGDAVEIDVEGIAATYPIAAARRQQRRARMASANLIERESLITMWTEAWEEMRRRFAESQEEILRRLRGEETRLNRFLYHLPHDNYHIGQIMYLRAMQGLEPIE